jgi:hypothetical protein
MDGRWRAEKGSKLAAARMEIHRLIDCRIEFGDEDRDAVYRDLAGKLHIPTSQCHAGMFTLSECQRAISVLRGLARN